MPQDTKQIVMAVLMGMKDYFQKNPDDADKANDMWSSEGNSITVLEEMIQFRCKEKAASGETSRLEMFNKEGGASTLRKMILSMRDDEDVGALLAAFSAAKHK